MARKKKRKPESGDRWGRWVAVAALLFGAVLIWDAVLQPKPSGPRTVQAPRPSTPAPKPAPRPEASAPRARPSEQPPSRQTERTPALPEQQQQAQPQTQPDAPEPSAQFLEPESNESPTGLITGLETRPQPEPAPAPAYPRSPNANPTPNTLVSVPGRAEPGLIFRRLQTKSEEKVIALTFDDGPSPQFTPQVLEILARYGVRATFFWVGREAERHPDTARAVAGAGHAVGNHTWTHRTAQSDEAAASDEIGRTAEAIARAAGQPPALFRPPGGRLNNGLADYALRNGYAVVMWSAQSNDWEPGVGPETIVQNVLQAARPGAVVLLHDGGGDRTRTVQALPQIIEGLQAQGYRFVTIPEMLAMQAAAPVAQ